MSDITENQKQMLAAISDLCDEADEAGRSSNILVVKHLNGRLLILTLTAFVVSPEFSAAVAGAKH